MTWTAQTPGQQPAAGQPTAPPADSETRAAQGARETAQQAAGQAQQAAQNVAGQAQEAAQQAAGQARGKLREQVDQRSTQAGEQVGSTANDVRTVGEQLREQGQERPARIAEQVAERTERVGGYLRDSDADRILGDVEDFARRRPWAIAAAGFAIGLSASRFLKASSAARYRDAHGSGTAARDGDGSLDGSGAPATVPPAPALGRATPGTEAGMPAAHPLDEAVAANFGQPAAPPAGGPPTEPLGPAGTQDAPPAPGYGR